MITKILMWLLVVLPPLYIAPTSVEPFRLPKLMLAEWLAVASLLPIAWQARALVSVGWRQLWRLGALQATLPLVAVATAGLALSLHPQQVHQALADLWIGAACLVGWSAGLPESRLRSLLGASLWPALALALFGILQHYGLQPLSFAGIRAGSRLAMTSLAGNPGDLAAFLVLPCLVAQWLLAQEGDLRDGISLRRLWLLATLAVGAYCMALTETFAALTALLLGSVVLWGVVLRGSAQARRYALIGGALVVVALGGVASLPSLRQRALIKLRAVTTGQFDVVFTGRTDGWRTALWMARAHPWAGVGQGAYRAEYAVAKLDLVRHGVAFWIDQQENFVNAHNEVLEVAADCGLPGVLALGWGVWIVAGAIRRRARNASAAVSEDLALPRQRIDAAFALAACVAVGVLCLVDFPFRIALVAFPALIFLAWVFRSDADTESAAAAV